MNAEPTTNTDSIQPFLRRFLVVITIVGIAMLGIWFHEVGFGKLSWDGILYTRLAENLAEGTGYRFSPEGPFHQKYFPGYPILIALISVLSADIHFAAGIIPVIAAGLLVVLMATAGPAREPVERLLGVFLLLCNSTFLLFSAMALSEVPFAAAAFLFLSALTREPSSRARTLSMTASFWISCLLRPEGMLLVPPLLLEGRKRGDSALQYLTLLSVPIGFWMCLLVLNGGEPHATYLDFGQLPSLVTIKNQIQALSLLGLVPIFLAVVGSVVGFSALRPFIIFAFLYGALHLSWFYVDVRLYAPLVPIFAVCAAKGLRTLADQARNLIRIPSILTIGLVLSLASLEQIPRLLPGGRQLYQMDSADYLHLYDSLIALQHASESVSQSCDYVLANEAVVYSAILKPSIQVDSYTSLEEVSTKLCKKQTARACIATDMIHKFVLLPLASMRAQQLAEVGCVDASPVWSSHPPSGYYAEIYRCSEIRCPSAHLLPPNV